MQDSVRFCPQCGSASVEYSALAGGAASCKGCRWTGVSDDMLVVPIQHNFALGKESIIGEMMVDLRKLLSNEVGLPWLKFLLKWGFMPGDMQNPAKTVDRKKYARYLAAIAHAVLTAVIAERAKQSQEQAQKAPNESPSN